MNSDHRTDTHARAAVLARLTTGPMERLHMCAAALGRWSGSIKCWWALALVWAALAAWANRYWIGGDGLNYLEIGSGVVQNPRLFVNGTWSPLLPAFIAATFSIFHPTPSQELPTLHALNVAVFILVLLCFTFFFRMWLASSDCADRGEERKWLVPFGFFAFLWFTMEYVGMMRIGPDLCVTGAAFLIAGMVCRISLPDSGWRTYGLLGCALALGYYAKAIMFPMSVALLCILVLRPPKRFSRKKLILSAVVFLVLSAPLAALISKRVGRPSTGEVGPVMYLWFVNGVQPFEPGWPLQISPIYGKPIHPPRTLTTKPTAIEFASPISGSFPLFYEPTYWYEGLHPRWNLGQQLAALRTTMQMYVPIVYYMAGFFAAALALLVWNWRKHPDCRQSPAVEAPRRPFAGAWLWLWPLTAFAIYGAVYVEHRYLAPFLALFWCAFLAPLLFRASRKARTIVLVGLLASHLLAVSGRVAWNVAHSRPPEYEKVGQALHDLGLHEGDQLAFVGDPLREAYYARFARMRIVAQIQDESAFWRMSEQELNQFEQRLAGIGVKAIVSRHHSGARPGTWFDVKMSNDEGFSILPIHDSGQMPGQAGRPVTLSPSASR